MKYICNHILSRFVQALITLALFFSADQVFADFNVSISTEASANGSWSGGMPNVWTPNATGSRISVTDILERMDSGVVISTFGAGAENGDISVEASLSWSTNSTLTLSALRDVTIKSNITATGSSAGLVLTPGPGGNFSVKDGAVITLSGANPSLSISGNTYAVINNINALQDMVNGLSGHYVLGSNIDASATSGWNSGAGFAPVGNEVARFSGTFDGFNHIISGLTINRPTPDYTGLFGAVDSAGIVRNVGLIGGSVRGSTYSSNAAVGGLVGYNYGTINNSFTTGYVENVGRSFAGGLVGTNMGSISNCYATGNVSIAESRAGGLVGHNGGTISNSYATGNVVGNSYGNNCCANAGFVGHNAGVITTSYSTGSAVGWYQVGGFVGEQSGSPSYSNNFWDTTVSGMGGGYGATGLNTAQMMAQANFTGFDFNGTWWIKEGNTRPFLRSEYSTVINNAHQLQLMGMSAATLAARYTLGADISMAELANSKSMWNTSTGFVPVGDSVNKFTGTFDGLKHTISGLTINRPSMDFVGLFGHTGTGSDIRNVGLTGVNITGSKYVGSLIGINSAGHISNSYSVGSVTGTGGGYSEVGGLVGENSSSGLIANCYTAGNVTGTGGGYAIGGLVGINFESSIDNSYSTSTVSGSANDVGGLVGNTYLSGSISNSYSAGVVSGGGSFIGALVGWNNTQHTVSNCYSSSSVNGTTGNLIGNGAGTITNSSLLSAPQMTSQSSFPSWDFTNVWWMNDGLSFPKLRSILYVPAGYSTSGLASIWRGEGNALDSAGNNHGLLYGGSGYAAGRLGSAFTFDGGVGSYMTVPASSAWAFGSGDFSIGFWVYGTTNDTKRPLINNRKTGASENMWAIEIYNVANRVEFHSGLTIYLTASNLINNSSWNHVAVTRSGTSLNMYINGVFSGSASVPNNFSEINDLQIGRDVMAGNQLGNTFAGSMDEIVIFNRALTELEISNMAGTQPNQFSFVPQTGMPLSTDIISSPETITGLSYPAAIIISGGQYSIGCSGSFTSAPGTISNGSTVCVRQTSSSGYSTKTTATLTIGGVAAAFDVTTAALGDPTALGLVSWWRGEDNALDAIGGNHGNAQNGASFATGKIGQAFSMDGSNDVVTAAAFDMGVDWTVAGWFAPSACSSIGVCPLFARSTGNTEGLLLAYLNQNFSTPSNRGKFVFDIGDGSTWQIEGYSSNVFSDNSWHHVAISKSGDTYALFVDGQQQFLTTTGGVSTAYQAHGIRIGHWSYGSGETYTGGRFDEIMVFNHPLSSKEILKLSNPGLISMWKAENDAVDSADASDGTWQGPAAYATGRSGQAFSFDGSGTRIDMADSIGDFGTNPFTVAFWINDSGAAYPSDGYIIGKSHPDGGQGWDIRIKDGQIRVVGVNGWGFNITSDASLTPHVWHHVALSATGTEVKLYIDGALKGTSPRGTISPTPNPLRLGFATNYGGSPLDGLLDEVSIYSRALTAAEIAVQHGLVSLWRGENNALDSVGSNSGSPQGAVTYSSGINGGQAFSCNGSDSSIRVAAPSGLPSGAAPRTVAAWIKSVGPTSGTKYQSVFGYGSPGIDGGSFLLEWGGEANDRRLYLTGWNRDLAGSSQLSYGQWYHVAATYDGTTVRLYVNGIEDASAPRSLNTVIGSNYAAIGTSPPNDGWHSFFNGLIDDLSVFDRVLGAAEVATLSGMVPVPFNFAPVVSAILNTEYESAPVQISGLSNAAGITVAGGQYAVSGDGTNWGAWSSSAGTVVPGSWVKFKATSSGSYGMTATATLTIGGVSAGFSVKTKNSVTVSSPGGNGSISCESPVDELGQSICTITPDYGYHLDTLSDNGSDVKGGISQSGNYTITDITANHEIVAGFAINIYTVTATAGANGGISPSGALQYQHGSSSSQFSVTPGNGYHILSVRKDGEDILVQNSAGFDAPPFTTILTDHTIDAVFTVNLTPGSARIVSPQADFQTLQDAYQSITSSGEILLLATLPGAPAFFATQQKTIWISGGYGSGYTPSVADFTVLGRLTVSNGKILARGVKIR